LTKVNKVDFINKFFTIL